MSDISRLPLYGDDELERVLDQVSSVLTVAGAPPGLINLYNAVSREQQARKTSTWSTTGVMMSSTTTGGMWTCAITPTSMTLFSGTRTRSKQEGSGPPFI